MLVCVVYSWDAFKEESARSKWKLDSQVFIVTAALTNQNAATLPYVIPSANTVKIAIAKSIFRTSATFVIPSTFNTRPLFL